MSSTERTDSMTRVRSLVPLAHVKNVSRSAGFYRKLGFSVENSFVPPDAPRGEFRVVDPDGYVPMVTHT